MNGNRPEHEPNYPDAKLVSADPIVVVAMCTCRNENCSWTASASWGDAVNNRADGSWA